MAARILATAQASSIDFAGLIGLPFLQLFQYGGDKDWFCLRKRSYVGSD